MGKMKRKRTLRAPDTVSPVDRRTKRNKGVVEEESLHYTKSGKLDMRYKSSREFLTRQKNASFNGISTPPSPKEIPARGHSLPFTSARATQVFRTPHSAEKQRPGTSSMNEVISVESEETGLSPLTTVGATNATPRGSTASQGMNIVDSVGSVEVEIPAHIPRTKTNLPDLRTKLGRKWVESQAREHVSSTLPSWLPRLKDGTLDTNIVVTNLFLSKNKRHTAAIPLYDFNRRMSYYQQKLSNQQSEFHRLVVEAKQESVTMPPFILLPNCEILDSYSGELKNFDALPSRSDDADSSFSTARSGSSSRGSSPFADADYKIPTYVPLLNHDDFMSTIGGDRGRENKIGNGAFGVVYKGTWNDQEVAIKKLFLNPLTPADKKSFMLEVKILASFGDHPNLVKLYGYTTDPATLVMEYVKQGSLSHLLYYCKDDRIEARLCDGRIKKRIAAGIVNGMRQLHSVGIIHGDLKPCNILITEDFNAKITDFGLSKLRGKTSSLVASRVIQDGENVVGGTAAYMAPELLKSDKRQELSSDVYSFGILLNELIHEKEPYSELYDKIRLMGPFGAAQLANEGKRPFMNTVVVPKNLQDLIKCCWTRMEWFRPTFGELVEKFRREDLIFPDFI